MAFSTSPLRYPGGKSCLYELTAQILRLNDLRRRPYAEPYAGGCGLALALLFKGDVSEIHINDIDPSIWAFWHCVLNRTDDFIAKLERTPVTVPEWRKQRRIHAAMDIKKPLELGFSAFFLNRTNRSGIIKGAGVIGGLKQDGDYPIDCRFSKEALAHRIKRIANYSDCIYLTRMDALAFLKSSTKKLPADTFFCIDPPYWSKGGKLYTNAYSQDDHATVAEAVLSLDRPWVVTYDDTSEIRSHYRERRQYLFDINYSVQTKRIGSELLIASKGLRLPDEIKDRQVHRPQYRKAA